MTSTVAADIPTPSLVVDTGLLERNIGSLHTALHEAGLRIRPHVKTHKSLEIARRQLAAGAAGLTVATIGEAEVFSAVSSDLFIAYPLWPDDRQFAALNALAETCRMAIGVDSTAALAHLAGNLDPRIELMIEIDSGHHRSGCAPPEAAAIARAAAQNGLTVRGVFTFPGHSYAPGGSQSAADDEAQALSQAADSIRAETGAGGLVLSGGSTPSVRGSMRNAARSAARNPEARNPAAEAVAEVRPGVYVFNDAQQWELGNARPEDIALTAYARIVSVRPGRIVLDAGSKILGADRAGYASGCGRMLDFPEARIVQLSEHHAVADLAEGSPGPPLGGIARLVPNHVCNAVNLVDELVPVTDGAAQPAWPVDARGRNR